MSMTRRSSWLGWSILLLGFAFLYLPILIFNRVQQRELEGRLT